MNHIGRLRSEHGLLLRDNGLRGGHGVAGGVGVARSKRGVLGGSSGRNIGELDALGGLRLDGGCGELGLLLPDSVLGSRLNGGSALGGNLRRLRSTSEEILNLGSVITSILLGNVGNVANLLLGNIANLVGLGVDHVRRGAELLVDELLVGGVDERNEEENGGSDDSKAPVRDELDKVVGDESSNTSLGFISFRFILLRKDMGLTAAEA